MRVHKVAEYRELEDGDGFARTIGAPPPGQERALDMYHRQALLIWPNPLAGRGHTFWPSERDRGHAGGWRYVQIVAARVASTV